MPKEKVAKPAVKAPKIRYIVGLDKEADRQAVRDSIMDLDGFEDVWGKF